MHSDSDYSRIGAVSAKACSNCGLCVDGSCDAVDGCSFRRSDETISKMRILGLNPMEEAFEMPDGVHTNLEQVIDDAERYAKDNPPPEIEDDGTFGGQLSGSDGHSSVVLDTSTWLNQTTQTK